MNKFMSIFQSVVSDSNRRLSTSIIWNLTPFWQKKKTQHSLLREFRAFQKCALKQ